MLLVKVTWLEPRGCEVFLDLPFGSGIFGLS